MCCGCVYFYTFVSLRMKTQICILCVLWATGLLSCFPLIFAIQMSARVVVTWHRNHTNKDSSRLFAAQWAEEELLCAAGFGQDLVLGKLLGCDSMFSVDFPSLFGVMSFPHRVNSKGVRLSRPFFKILVERWRNKWNKRLVRAYRESCCHRWNTKLKATERKVDQYFFKLVSNWSGAVTEHSLY